MKFGLACFHGLFFCVDDIFFSRPDSCFHSILKRKWDMSLVRLKCSMAWRS